LSAEVEKFTKNRFFSLVASNDDGAACFYLHTSSFTKRSSSTISFHRHACFHAPRFLIDSRVQYSTIPSTSVFAKMILFLNDYDIARVAFGEFSSDATSNNTCADDNIPSSTFHDVLRTVE
jgi:hypothetical protein